MSFASQKMRVDNLTRSAAACAAEQARHQAAIRRWRQRTFAAPGVLAWAFAAGAFWAAGHGGDRDSSSRERRQERRRRRSLFRKMLGAANTGLIAWRLMKATPDVAA